MQSYTYSEGQPHWAWDTWFRRMAEASANQTRIATLILGSILLLWHHCVDACQVRFLPIKLGVEGVIRRPSKCTLRLQTERVDRCRRGCEGFCLGGRALGSGSTQHGKNHLMRPQWLVGSCL